ncbi:MAG TPA: hypothetical protein VJB57_04140 [Dehalococcoidia bacterium]|nr:hypothetical protein [Dehalococcoidia bacterium]
MDEQGLTTAEINDALREVATQLGLKDSDFTRTIQRRRLRGARWQVAPDEADIEIKLESLAVVVVRTEGKTSQLTEAEAVWIGALGRAFPDLPPFERYQLARLYVSRRLSGEETGDLDLFLGLRPWRSQSAAMAAYEAIMDGIIPPPPEFLGALVRAAWVPVRIYNANPSRPGKSEARLPLRKLVERVKADADERKALWITPWDRWRSGDEGWAFSLDDSAYVDLISMVELWDEQGRKKRQ